jgi:hypothetical protein
MHVHEQIEVNRPRNEVYAFWRNVTQLPLFMEHLIAVEGDPYGITFWKAKSLTGTVEWKAEVVKDEQDEMISWHSLGDSEVRNSGAVRFRDATNGGTDVQVDISYDPPLGALGVAVAKIFGDAPDQEVSADLKRFKEIMESGQGAVGEMADMRSAAKPVDPVAEANRRELERAQDGTHATTNEPPNDSVADGDGQIQTGSGMITGGTAVDQVEYASTGIVGTSAAGRHDIVVDDAARATAHTGSEGMATDIDPARRGTRTGTDQDPIDGNDRDVAERDRGSRA